MEHDSDIRADHVEVSQAAVANVEAGRATFSQAAAGARQRRGRLLPPGRGGDRRCRLGDLGAERRHGDRVRSCDDFVIQHAFSLRRDESTGTSTRSSIPRRPPPTAPGSAQASQ